MKQDDTNKFTKFVLKAECVICFLIVAVAVCVGVFAAYVDMSIQLRVLVFAVVLAFVLGSAFLCVYAEQKNGYYECTDCGYKYHATYKEVLFAPHKGRNRKLTCSECGNKNYHKYVMSDGEDA